MAVLLLSQAGAGKTERAQRVLLDCKQADPLAKVWVLLSSERQIIDFRRRFIAETPVSFNVEYFNFYDLYRRILSTARQPGRALFASAQSALIRALLRSRFADSPVFGAIIGAPGLARAVGGLIDELKQHRIQPEDFFDAASNRRELELAGMYKAYQEVLIAHDLIDREGEGWLAVEALQQDADLVRDVRLMVVDGYDQFNPLQAALLAELDRQVGEMLITLTTIPGGEATLGRRFQQARERLGAAFGARLTEQFIERDSAAVTPPAVWWLEAPDPAAEAAAVMRRVKRRLVEGCPPEALMIAVRDWRRYGGHLATAARLYGVPLALHYGAALAETPCAAALIDLLGLHGGFRRREVLDALRSPYFAAPGLDAAAVDRLEAISLAARVIGGREEWLDAVRFASRPSVETDDEFDAARTLDAAESERLARALEAFFDGVTPPAEGEGAGYVRWLERLIGEDARDPDDADDGAPESLAYTLNLPAQIRLQPPEQAARDLTAMKALKDILRGMIASAALSAAVGLPQRLDRAGFLTDFLGALSDAPVERGAGRDGRVLATTAANARGLPHRHVCIVGLAEGVFPAPTPGDPLLLDSERARLRSAGVDLPESAERANDEGLFLSLIGTAHETLTLSRPYLKDGEAWGASHLWGLSRAGLPADLLTRQTSRLAIDGAAGYDEASSPAEAALAVVDAARRGQASTADLTRRRAAWLKAQHPDYWRHIVRAGQIEARRMSSAAPFEATSGVLSDPDLIRGVGARIAQQTWSASGLNDYGCCPYRYLAHRLLEIEPLELPEDGMDVRQRGTLYHEILEATYRQIGAEGLSITPDHLPRALVILAEACDRLLADAPARIGFRASAVWMGDQVTIRRRLRTLVESDFSPDNPLKKLDAAVGRTPFQQELRFGEGDLVRLDLGGGAVLRLRGAIDRIDRLPDGRIVLVDYKSGSTSIEAKEIARGRNFQMFVYLEAARRLHPSAEVLGGTFWHLSSNSGSGALVVAESGEVLAAGREKLRDQLARMTAGDFRSRPNTLEDGKCASYCQFYQLCRPAVIARNKAAASGRS